MMYIKLATDMSLNITVWSPIYRGDNLSSKITYLIPFTVGEIDMAAAAVYLNYVRADGTADIVLLKREDDNYNESYYQYTLPITSNLSRYAGTICTWLQIMAGPPSSPIVAKSGECALQILASKSMDEYIDDRHLSMVYNIQKKMEEELQRQEEEIQKQGEELTARIDENAEAITTKADNVTYDPETKILRLTSNGEPIGDEVTVVLEDGSVVLKSVTINDDGELILTFDDGVTRNMGVVVGKDGGVYVPNIDEHSVLTFTFEETVDPEQTTIGPIDLNPNDEWSDIDSEESSETTKTSYIWENM